jgi:2,4-dienoyl-CoA reductase (NADPH2)
MVVGQDLGITLDLEQWWIRATAKGIVQSIEVVAQGFEPAAHGARGAGTLLLQHHPTGRSETRQPDWVVLAVPADPAERLYLDLRAAGIDATRAGDCVAPRRAHAAVIEGERAGSSIGVGARR